MIKPNWVCKARQSLGNCLGFGANWFVLLAVLAGCAPTPDEIRGNNMWRNFSEDTTPPIPPPPVRFVSETAPIKGSPGDVSIWRHPTEPKKSIFFGLDESKVSTGLYSYDLHGKQIEHISNLNGPNDVKVEYGFETKQNKRIDIVAVLERNIRKVRFYSIEPSTRRLTEVTGNTRVFKDLVGPEGSPTCMALYRDDSERTYIFVARKVTDGDGIIWQYELKSNQGKIDLVFVREFGDFSGVGIVDHMLVDAGNGYLYYCDKEAGVRKYSADAATPHANHELNRLGGFNGSGFQGSLTSLGLFVTPGERGKGFIVMVDRREKSSAIKTYKREGEIDSPHEQTKVVEEIVFDVDNPGGIDITSMPIKNEFPEGVIVMANASKRNFRVFSWKRARIQRSVNERMLRNERKRDVQ